VTVHPFIEAENRDGHSVKRACELLQVSRAAFYARRSGRPGPRALNEHLHSAQKASVATTS
jgi:hypothetical protein